MARAQVLRDPGDQRADLGERRGAIDGRHDVEALRSGRLYEGRQLELVEQLVKQPRDLAHEVELAVGWIEIEDDLVGPVGRGRTARPDVKRDAALVGEVDQRGRRVADRILDARLAAERRAIDPRGVVLLDVLLKEPALIDRPGEPLHREQRPRSSGTM